MWPTLSVLQLKLVCVINTNFNAIVNQMFGVVRLEGCNPRGWEAERDGPGPVVSDRESLKLQTVLTGLATQSISVIYCRCLNILICTFYFMSGFEPDASTQ